MSMHLSSFTCVLKYMSDHIICHQTLRYISSYIWWPIGCRTQRIGEPHGWEKWVPISTVHEYGCAPAGTGDELKGQLRTRTETLQPARLPVQCSCKRTVPPINDLSVSCDIMYIQVHSKTNSKFGDSHAVSGLDRIHALMYTWGTDTSGFVHTS